MQAPRAKKVPHVHEEHGHQRFDEYFWLNQREDPEVVAYLEAENAFTKATLAHAEPLWETVFQEIKGRIKQDDSTPPAPKSGFYYYARFEEGQQYPIYCRREGAVDAPEQIMFDANVMAKGHEYFHLGAPCITPDQKLAAFATDSVGRRKYETRFRNLETGETYDEVLTLCSGSMAWASDNHTFFYARMDDETLRSHQIWRHRLGSDVSQDELIYEETDDTFNVYVHRTRSGKYLMISSYHSVRSEIRVLSADDPEGKFQLFLPRGGEHEYSVDHGGEYFYVASNDGARNFRLFRTPVDNFARDQWEEILPHREDVLLAGFDVFATRLVVTERCEGLIRLRIMPFEGEEHVIDFGEPAYDAWVDANYEFETGILRYGYTSMTTPKSIFDYDTVSRQKHLVKQDEVLGGFDSGDYVTERLQVPARDGAIVPVSIVYKKGFKRDGSSPLYLYAYGSYGLSLDAGFNSSRLSLLDRGFAFAIAHIRGGQEMGRAWYDTGKKLKKKNTFNDFIDCAEYLVAQKYTSSSRMYCGGGSAGGLLMGAVLNMRPDLFHGAIAHVPFVDVVTTMLDESIPLTTGEYDEWGDPRQKDFYEYILSYSPYDNVTAQAYPHLLVTTGLHDSQVQYWEPAKWVARLRDLSTSDNRLLMKTNMGAGHGGASGRYERYREVALDYVFLIDLASGASA